MYQTLVQKMEGNPWTMNRHSKIAISRQQAMGAPSDEHLTLPNHRRGICMVVEAKKHGDGLNSQTADYFCRSRRIIWRTPRFALRRATLKHNSVITDLDAIPRMRI